MVQNPARALKPRPMDDEELKTIVRQQVDIATGHIGGEITETRRKLLDQYRSEPYGNEIEGRSKIVASDIFDVIEAIMPDLMEVFTAGDKVVEFQPEEENDEDHAEMATDYINWIVLRDNPGWLILYDLFKDALLQINGIGKVYWDSKETIRTYRYENLDDDELTLLADDDEVEILEHTEEVSKDLSALAEQMGLDMSKIGIAEIENFVAQNIPEEVRPVIRTHSVKIKRTSKKGRIHIENIPPEEFIISRRAKTVDDADFCAHKVRKTVTDLIQEGFDPDIVRSLPTFDEAEYNEERVSRFSRDDEWPYEADSPDDATRTVWVVECYMRVDYDGDGVAEYRKIIVAGSDYMILENDEVPRNPFFTVTPIREPHKFFGRAFAELVQDIQLMHTTVWRQILDNMYQVNSNRHVINSRVNQDDMLSNIVGGVVVAKGNQPVGEAVMPLVTQPLGNFAFPLLEYIDTQRETRTGVTRYSQGLDASSLNKTATGITKILERTQRRVQLVARLFAESGVKDMFRKCLAEVIEHQDFERAVRLSNKEWKNVDPRTWNAHMDVIINVGIGYGTPESRMQGAMAIVTAQKEIIQVQGGLNGPIVFGHNFRNGLAAYTEGFGFPSADPFFAPIKEGQEIEPPGQGESPEMAKVKAEMEAKKAELQMKAQAEQASQQMKMQAEQASQQMKTKEAEDKNQLEIRSQDLEHERKLREIQLEHERKMLELQVREQTAGADIALKREIAENDASIKERQEQAAAELARVKDEREGKSGNGKDSGEPVNINLSMSGKKTIKIKRDKSGKITGGEVSE